MISDEMGINVRSLAQFCKNSDFFELTDSLLRPATISVSQSARINVPSSIIRNEVSRGNSGGTARFTQEGFVFSRIERCSRHGEQAGRAAGVV